MRLAANYKLGRKPKGIEMTKQEIKSAEQLLSSRVDRTEIIGTGEGNFAITAYWLTGGQKIFHSLDHVQEHVADREQKMTTERDAPIDDYTKLSEADLRSLAGSYNYYVALHSLQELRRRGLEASTDGTVVADKSLNASS